MLRGSVNDALRALPSCPDSASSSATHAKHSSSLQFCSLAPPQFLIKMCELHQCEARAMGSQQWGRTCLNNAQ